MAQSDWMKDTTKPDEKPEIRSMVDPEYTPEARRSGITGNVELLLRVDETGHVLEAVVVRGLGHGLDEKALEAARRYVFKPAKKQGMPIAYNVYIVVNFML